MLIDDDTLLQMIRSDSPTHTIVVRSRDLAGHDRFGTFHHIQYMRVLSLVAVWAGWRWLAGWLVCAGGKGIFREGHKL